MSHIADSLAAWLLVPVVIHVTAVGLGLLVGRLARVTLPPALVAPLGLCAAIVLAMAGLRLGGGAWLALALLLTAAASGFALVHKSAVRALAPGWAGLAALAVYGLYVAPVVLSGAWTWTGYNFVNDTAVQMLLIDHLGERGLRWPVTELRTEAQIENVSTSDATIYFYLRAAYPTGSHGVWASLKPLVPGPTAAQYVPFMAALAGHGALALYAIASRLVRPRVAGAIALTAMAANLTYQYHLQGNIKEVAALTTLAVGAALAAHLLDARRPVATAALLGLSLVALLSVFGAAGVPFAGALVLATVVALLVTGSTRPLRAWLGQALAVGGAVVVAGALVAAHGLIASFRVLNEVFSSEAGTTVEAEGATNPVVSPLGHLVRPLPLVQASGVWLARDYRFPLSGDVAVINRLLIAAVALLALAGVVIAVRRRRLGPLIGMAGAGITVAVLSPLVAPYAAAKLLAIASPFVVLLAGLGAWALWSVRRVLGAVAAMALAGGVFVSDALAYNAVKLAPTDRMLALEEMGERFAGEGDVLLVENEEFGKYFLRAADDVSAFDSISPRQVQLRTGTNEVGRFTDTDGQVPAFLQAFPIIVQRRSPAVSRPPANYRLDHRNEYYEAWVRVGPRLHTVDRLPIGTATQASLVPLCADVAAFAETAAEGDVLVGAVREPPVELLPAVTPRPAAWHPDPVFPALVQLNGPGRVAAPLTFDGGRYRAWVAGSFGRPITARIDGEAIGKAHGIDSPGQWSLLGEVRIEPGRHWLALERPGGGLAPGNGHGGVLGPLSLEPVEPIRLVRVDPSDARELCGLPLDWVERVPG